MTAHTLNASPSPSDRFHCDITRDRNPLLLALIHANSRVVRTLEDLQRYRQLTGREVYILGRSSRTIFKLAANYDAFTAQWWSPSLAASYREGQ